ncbi:MAG: hypothetical protein ACKPFA_34140, partial [Dolichospermum sp.]
KAFSESKIFKWFISQISKQQEKEIYFGNLSSIINNSLLDDPKPYRKEIKELQKNFYAFLKAFDFNEIKLMEKINYISTLYNQKIDNFLLNTIDEKGQYFDEAIKWSD